MATKSSTKCPWKQFCKHIIKYMDNLHTEACEPQMKIARFMDAVKHNFASTTIHLTKEDKKSTKQTQTTEKPKMAQDPSSSTKRTSNSDTDSAYNTESESNSKTSHISTSTHQPKPSTSTSHLSTSTCLQKPSTSTWSNTETTVQQPTVPATRTSSASTYPQHMRKAPLLPTPPASTRNFNYSNHFKQCISGPSAFNRNPTFTRPSPFYNRFYNQHISGPSPSRYNTYPTF